MKNQKGATSLEILLTLVILLIIAGTAVAMIAGSFDLGKESTNNTTNQTTNAIEDENKITKDEE